MRPPFNARSASSPYWNQYLETMPRDRLDALALRKLQLLTTFAYEHSPFYRQRFDAIGLKPADIKSLDDFKRKVPLTDKTDFIYLQEETPPYGLTGALPEDLLHHHCETSGSTGVALRVPLSMYDTERYGESWTYGFWGIGIRPADSFYFAFNWGLFAGFWSAYWGVRRFGSKIYSGGGQTTEGHLRMLQRLRPTVLMATPTYALHLAEAAKDRGIDPSGFGLKYVVTAGEPGPHALPAVREQLDRAFGAISTELYGAAELGPLAPGCPTREGDHMDESNYFSWSRDPVTGEEVPEGPAGENIVTSFVINAQPLLNYRTHDMVERHLSCVCGRTWAFLRGVVLGRSDFMVTVRGTNVYQAAVENTLAGVEGISSHYELILTREKGLDQMTVRAEPIREVPASGHADLAATAARRLKEIIGVRIDVELVPVESLPRFELKTKRLIDQRPQEVRRELDR